jgi:hypothetical protein
MIATRVIADNGPTIAQTTTKDDVLARGLRKAAYSTSLSKRILLIATGVLVTCLGLLLILPVELIGPSEEYRKEAWMIAAICAPIGTWFVLCGTWLVMYAAWCANSQEGTPRARRRILRRNRSLTPSSERHAIRPR